MKSKRKNLIMSYQILFQLFVILINSGVLDF